MNRKIFNDLADYIMDTYGVNIIDADLKDYNNLIDYIDDKVVGTYFSATKPGEAYWKPDNNWHLKNSGQKLIDRMQKQQWETWLDVGCGENKYKRYFGDRVTGIDPYNELADIKTDVMSYNPDFQYDIVSAFGSINFGDRAVIEPQVEKVVSFCKPGGTIFWRCNPGITHDDPDNKAYWIDFFEWSEELIYEFADKFGCTVEVIKKDNEADPSTIRYGNRHYSEWTKK